MRRTAVFAALLAVAASAHAAVPDADASAAVASSTDKQHWSDLDGLLRNAHGHPNEYWRLQAADAASQKRWSDAFELFRRAARYADKYSQHRVSLMYWHGVGVAKDRALAYAWADLSAERMYPQFVLQREKMWLQLSEAERAEAVAKGQAVYDEFGDHVAKKRFTDAMAHAKRQVTGSRTGSVGNLAVTSPGAGNSLTGLGGPSVGEIYADARWDEERYWKVEDALWKNGSVNVGELETVDSAKASAPAP